MTVTETPNPTGGITVDPEALRALSLEAARLDEEIAAASGSVSQGKRAYLNSLVNTRMDDDLNSFVQDIVSNLSNVSEVEDLIALTESLDRAIKQHFGEQIDKHVDAYLEANKPEESEKVSDTELESMMDKARTLRKRFDSMAGVLEMFGFDISDIQRPKRLSGSRGPRGPRTLSKFDYFVDGVARTKHQNSLSSIASTLLKDTELGKTKHLREWLVQQGLDIENPPDEWEYTLPNGKVLKAVKSEETDEYEASDDDDEDENENE